MQVSRITAVLLAEDVRSCAQFWVERLGFEKTIEVPEGDGLAFISLNKGKSEVMYQSYSSVERDAPETIRQTRRGPTFLYVEVDKLDAVKAAMTGAEVVMPERLAFYGAREITVKDPAGHFLTFAQFGNGS
jgi:uncharacterized glyoxalase superfamily protein PhnB